MINKVQSSIWFVCESKVKNKLSNCQIEWNRIEFECQNGTVALTISNSSSKGRARCWNASESLFAKARRIVELHKGIVESPAWKFDYRIKRADCHITIEKDDCWITCGKFNFHNAKPSKQKIRSPSQPAGAARMMGSKPSCAIPSIQNWTRMKTKSKSPALMWMVTT